MIIKFFSEFQHQLPIIICSFIENCIQTLIVPVPIEKCPVVCPRVPEPVCAADGNTYVNECIMKTIGNLTIVHEGCCGKLNLSAFQPNIYRILQISPSTLNVVCKYEIFRKIQKQTVNRCTFSLIAVINYPRN